MVQLIIIELVIPVSYLCMSTIESGLSVYGQSSNEVELILFRTIQFLHGRFTVYCGKKYNMIILYNHLILTIMSNCINYHTHMPRIYILFYCEATIAM